MQDRFIPYWIIIVNYGLQTLAGIGIPDSSGNVVSPSSGVKYGPYIRPSIAHETIRVPSWLKLTAVTGSE